MRDSDSQRSSLINNVPSAGTDLKSSGIDDIALIV